MSVTATFNKPAKLEVIRDQQQPDGRVLVYGYDGDGYHAALVLWLTPQVAAEWIEALTPLAAEAQQ